MPLERAPLIYVMGPSGAGKDSVLAYARANLAAHDKVAFAHRYITRISTSGGENHIALTQDEFDLRRSCGLFAYDWRAHEMSYGIGIEVQTWRRAGLSVVMNGSRGHFASLGPDGGAIVPVVITAPAEVLAQRLARRGRETQAQILERLQRQPEAPDHPDTIVIDNSGALEIAGSRLLDLLRSLARTDAAA